MTKARTLADNFAADINGITAGTGITGGGTSGTVTVTNEMATTITAKGDLLAGTGNAAFDNLAAGNNGETLVADSSTSTGLRWQSDYAAGKNKVINGDFGIWQRGTSFSADGYTADRFRMALSGATATTTRQSFTVGQTDVPNNPTYFARLDVTTGDNACRLETLLEDVVLSSGQTFTLSFWAKGTNPAGGSMEIFSRQEFGAGGSSAVATSQGTITLTASWQRFTKTFTYASVSGKTIAANNSYGFDIRQPGADTGVAAWTMDLANVQLEAGSVATAFQTATGTLAGELAACQRYYYQAATGTEIALGSAFNNSATLMRGIMTFPVTLRTNPTLVASSGTGYYNYRSASSDDLFNSLLIGNTGTTCISVYNNTEISGTAGQGGYILTNNASASVAFSAEL